MECKICRCDIDPDMAWYEDMCDECACERCPVCEEEYSGDDDGGVCWNCDMEIFAVFTDLI